ncbi:outer membrane beta-barrel family protein [Pedobacter caeni]|uniref:Outer membrane receptor proteins, mostly Fe transport n=1 Tax=Pedobacter caeni TaxID=288992 RepID=A0A1M4Z6H1_9SPHI|nr:TonB-dependent receptor [Pedobacter caeni]SHF13590.1 Outer membrane receptor proteins, mostly Fe transport [Pedobacter caeni]
MKNSAKVWNTGMICAHLTEILFINKQFIIWLMRVSFVLFLFILTSLQLLMAVEVNGQRMSEYKVSLKLEEESLLTGLKKIEAQSTFRFYYRKAEVKQITGLHLAFNTRTVENTLYELLKNTDFSFRQIDNHILLEKRRPQTGYTVKGRIIGQHHKPVELVTIQISKITNQNITFSALPDTGGRFILKVYEQGDYLLRVSSPETDSLTQTVTVGSTEVLQLPDIVLTETAIQLKNVTIMNKRALISRSVDKLTFNVEGSIYEKGENALRLFNVIPGVSVLGKNILFRGSESVSVYVDNRRILLPGDQLLAYLRAIPSESIKSYELKAVPGAEHDAQHGGVIINIVLKSEYKYGLSGSISTGYWYTKYHNTRGNAFLNYRAGKLNIQGNVNYSRAPAFYEDNITQEFKSTGAFSRQTEKYTEHYHAIAYNIGLDYKLNYQQTVGFNYNMFSNPGDFSNITTTNIDYFSNAEASSIDSSSYTNKNTRFSYTNRMANAFYRNKLDTNDSKLDIGYSYIYYGLKDPSAIETNSLNGFFTNTTGKSMIHVANADLEKHFSNTLTLNAGAKYTASGTDYSMDYRIGLSEQSPLDPLRSDRFRYNEYILAFYSTLAKSFKQWEIKLGLRTEQTNYHGKSASTGQTIGRNQWDLFPSVHLNKKIGENHSFTLSYNRRIERPGFRQLNPFVIYTNPYTLQEGNPNLLSFYSNNIQLEYLLKNKYSLTIGYQNTNNAITTNVTNKGNVIISKDENISDNDNVFMSVYIPIRITNWWEFNTNTTLRYRTIDIRGTSPLQRSKFTQNIWATNKFNLPGKYFIEVSGIYNSSSFYDIYDQFSIKKIDITIKKSFFKDRLSSSIELQDPFHLYKPQYEINTPEFSRNVLRSRLDWARNFGIHFTYNFSSGKKQSSKENIDAAGNEARRRL